MNKMMNYIKTHKKKCTIIGICFVIIIIFIIFLYSVISYLMPDTRASVYGDRCDVTADYPVAGDRKDTIKKFLNDYKTMSLDEFEVKCNLIDVVINVEDKESLANVKKMGKALLGVFSDDEKKYYDIQLIITSDNDKSENYPQIGTHHKEINGSSNEDFVW